MFGFSCNGLGMLYKPCGRHWELLIIIALKLKASHSNIIMIGFYSFSLLLISLSLASGQDLTASLDYGTFQGSYSSSYNISYWRKIPFAAPPIGENRFRGPQPPAPIINGTYNSSQSFDMCPQRTVRSRFLLARHLANKSPR